MSGKKTIGLLTIGQSPRPDMTADLHPIFENKADYIEAGALDGLTKEQIASMNGQSLGLASRFNGVVETHTLLFSGLCENCKDE